MTHPFGSGWQGRIPSVDPRRWKTVIAFGAVVILVLLGLFSSVYTVQPEGRAVVKRFGRVIRIEEPGLQLKLPFGIEDAIFIPTERVLKEEFGFRTERPGQRTVYRKTDAHTQESMMLSGDLNVIDVEWVVQFRIQDPNLFLHRVRNVQETIRDVSEAVMRQAVGNRLGSDVLTIGRVEIAALAREEIQSVLDSYNMGVQVTAVELQDVTPPDPVKPAFNEVNEARQERERLINEAEKQKNEELFRVEGEAEQIRAEALGYKAERINTAKGDVARFVALLEQYQDAPEITRKRLYLETMEDVLQKAGKIYIVEPGQVMPIPLLNVEGASGLPATSGGR
jgi:membrane protease subunit HflK